MNNTPNRASNPAGKPRRKDASFDLSTARSMLPLVRGIVADIRNLAGKLAELRPLQERMERQRRELTWAERDRRYAMQDDIAQADKSLAGVTAELDGLGVSLVDAARGEVDFPTRINGRNAAFNWLPDEPTVGHWHYAGDDVRRAIPADWQSGTPMRARAE